MKYRVKLYRKVWIEENYEMDVPDSILAEMHNGEDVDENELFNYIYGETHPISKEEIEDIDWEYTIEKIDEIERSSGE